MVILAMTSQQAATLLAAEKEPSWRLRSIVEIQKWQTGKKKTG